MFTFKTVVDQVAKNSKTALSYVENKDLRASLEDVVDANTKFVSTMYDFNLELAKQVVEKFGDYEYTKSFADVAKKFVSDNK